jgi:RNA polymerase sigma-70 factor, ECF subfamily
VVIAGTDVAVTRAPNDRGEFADWVRPHMESIARLAARLAPYAERDDVVQEALARAWQKRAQFDPGRGVARNWLLAITADQAAKAARRARRPRAVQEVGASSDVELRMDIERAMTTLTARQCDVVNCVYFVGLTIADIAIVLGISVGTVKSTLFDARLRLRDVLEVSE